MFRYSTIGQRYQLGIELLQREATDNLLLEQLLVDGVRVVTGLHDEFVEIRSALEGQFRAFLFELLSSVMCLGEIVFGQVL